MTIYSKINIIYRLQKWMDSVPGQTFLNYAYSWGASIVILGTLFKLTHLPGANFFLFLGMGTEVFVFFISAFDRPFDKTADGMELDIHTDTSLPTDQHAGGGTVVIGGGGSAPASGVSGVSGGGTIVIGGGGAPASGAPVVDSEAIAAVSSSVISVSGGSVPVSGGASAPSSFPQMTPELEEATTNYVTELKRLTEMLSRVSEQTDKLAHDSEEMENLNRTLTGICKVYELQLKSASSQIGTIDDINEQTRKMAAQIAELNKIYARMIEAMTAKMNVPVSPRQKMINLMYVVLMAMLALNVSSEVLNGFSIVEDSLNRTTNGSIKENKIVYDDLEMQMRLNPTKVKAWYDKAQEVRRISDSLYNFAEELKLAIVREADGKNATIEDFQNKEDLEAANQVMLAPGRGKGQELFNAIRSFRNRVVGMTSDMSKQQIINANLSTSIPRKAEALGKNWQEFMFEDMPAVAAVTLLSKLQSDVRYAEREVLHTLVQNIDVKDIRVNALSAFVIPSSQTIVRGDRFSARIVMAAVDTTQVPDIYIGNQKVTLNNGLYETICNRTGDFTLAGYMETVNGNGDHIRRDFSQKYTVVDPSATVSADLMNMLYAGYNNPISVSVPGVPSNKIQASMTNGTLQSVGPGKYIARPSKIGQDVTITVVSTNTGRPQQMGQYTFRVRKLPDPTPYISMKDEHGNPTRYKGGGLAKSQLVAANAIGAAIDDGILDIAFRVQSFETVFFDNMGNAVPMASDGASFSERQKDTFRKLARNRRFYVSRVTVVGPDGLTRTLQNPMEVIVK